ncbi:MAG: glutamate--tRNA ligase [Negativicutes bacterium]|mgnify:CR=1 FL=1|nr:glutamate--tRNA ligase [Negativicutes bacterium]
MSDVAMRVRFAPSPTGPFHIGGARSALFNWLLARKTGGKLILRIEDTDLERSSRESEENIKNALKWLGIDWDEGIDIGGEYGPYRQTERLPIYAEYTERLLASGKAYRCYCTDQELDAERQKLMAEGQTPRYLGKCRQLTAADEAALLAEGRKPTVRFRVPENQDITFQDAVRGTVSFDSNGIGDYVIVKSDGIPVYNYAVVLDDALMKITHVVRAEEHLSNTPRQILLYQALGLPLPIFGHVSLILGKDRSKMSKRHGATSVEQYKALGYLPEALVNFLALLGWSPVGEQEIFSSAELIELFSLDHVAKNPAVFDIDKLNWINSQYLKRLDLGTLTDMALPHLREAGLIEAELTAERKAWVTQVVGAVREYISFAAQIPEHAAVFFQDEITMENDETADVLRDPDVPQVMEAFLNKLAAMDPVDGEQVQAALKAVGKELKLGGKKVFMPVRVALTGKMHGPELIALIPLLGVARTTARIRRSLALVQ